MVDEWGFADAKAALEAIPDWIAHNQWQGCSVDTKKWLVVGHSNGGE